MDIHIHIICNKKELARERLNFYKSSISILGKNNVSYGYKKKKFKNKKIVNVWFDPPSHYIPNHIFNSEYTIYIGIDTYKSSLFKIILSNIFSKTYFMHPIKKGLKESLLAKDLSIISHGVTKEDSNKISTKREWAKRRFDIAFIGGVKGKKYLHRKKILNKLATKYKLNNWEEYYNPEKVVELYSESKIVINLPRNDHRSDANTRCFEGMAAGSLLITPEKSELNYYGFSPGEHYLEFLNNEDLTRKIEMVIRYPKKYREIALKGQLKTNLYHNYENITKLIINDLKTSKLTNNILRKIPAIAIYFTRKLYQKLRNFSLNR